MADLEGETAAVYEAYMDRQDVDYPGPVILQDLAVPVSVKFVADWRDGAPDDEVSREFSPEVREALRNLVDRGRAPAARAERSDHEV